jgi:hypothetical protein
VPCGEGEHLLLHLVVHREPRRIEHVRQELARGQHRAHLLDLVVVLGIAYAQRLDARIQRRRQGLPQRQVVGRLLQVSPGDVDAQRRDRVGADSVARPGGHYLLRGLEGFLHRVRLPDHLLRQRRDRAEYPQRVIAAAHDPHARTLVSSLDHDLLHGLRRGGSRAGSERCRCGGGECERSSGRRARRHDREHARRRVGAA